MRSTQLVQATALAFVPALCALGAQAPASATDVSYRFHYERAGDRSVSIEIAWPDPLGESRPLVMPRAIPMGYGEQRYDAFVSDLRAFGANGRRSTPAREEGPRWRLDAGTRVTYRVNLQHMEQEVRAA